MPRIVQLELASLVLPDWHPEAYRSPSCAVYGYAVDHPDGVILFDTGVGSGNDLIDELYDPDWLALEDALRLHSMGIAEVAAVVTLAHLDRLWRDHLSHVAEVREAIPLVRLANQEPLAEFHKQVIEAFEARLDALDDAIAVTFERVPVTDDGVDLDAVGLGAPTSTWTYVVNDEAFRNQLDLGGFAGGLAIAINFPLVVAWLLWRRYRRKR